MLMKDDYSKANIPMLPSVVGIKATFKPMTLHTVTLILLTLVMTFVNSKLSYIYFFSCLFIGTYYLFLTYKLYKDYDRQNNLKIYKFSLLYMMLFSVIVIVDSLV